jgi:hypothetical protein
METIIDFVKNFRLASYGITTFDVWLFLGLLLVTFVAVRWLTSFLPESSSAKIRSVITVVSLSVLYSVIAFIILKAFLAQRYGKVAVMIFTLVVPYVKTLYKLYDDLIDKWMGNTNSNK